MSTPAITAYNDVLDSLITAAAGVLNLPKNHDLTMFVAAFKAELNADPQLTREKAIGLLALAVTRLAQADPT